MRTIRNPVALFLVIGVITIAAILLGVNYLADDAASEEAITETTRVNDVLAHQFVEPRIPRGLAEGSAAAADRLDRRLSKVNSIDGIERFTVRGRDGAVLYSTEGFAALTEKPFPLDSDQRRVIEVGGSGYQTSDPSRPENFEGEVPQVEIYTRIKSPEGIPLLVDSYFALTELEERQEDLSSTFRWIVLGPLVLLLLMASLILVGLTRQVRRGAQEEERLLRSAMDASDAERRRIARDLHDSVVQDLAGSAFAVSAIARNPETPEDSRQTLEDAGTSLRTSLKSLRSLLAEIHPPDLHAVGLPAALSDLIAPASTAGIQASVSVEGAETMADDKAALVWRVAQEAVRNAIRHSEASTLAVTVNSDGKRLALEVVDDGVGFDPSVRDPHSYGLRGLRSLVVDSGGTLEVRSAPGEGTTVRMEVDAR